MTFPTTSRRYSWRQQKYEANPSRRLSFDSTWTRSLFLVGIRITVGNLLTTQVKKRSDARHQTRLVLGGINPRLSCWKMTPLIITNFYSNKSTRCLHHILIFFVTVRYKRDTLYHENSRCESSGATRRFFKQLWKLICTDNIFFHESPSISKRLCTLLCYNVRGPLPYVHRKFNWEISDIWTRSQSQRIVESQNHKIAESKKTSVKKQYGQGIRD